MVYETSRKINDWRYRNETDKIITLLFSCDYIDGTTKAQDDIMDVGWFKLEEIMKMITDKLTNEEHNEMLKFLINKYKKQ